MSATALVIVTALLIGGITGVLMVATLGVYDIARELRRLNDAREVREQNASDSLASTNK